MRCLLATLAAVGALLGASNVASADVPPPNECSPAGTDCENAPPDYKSPGTCTKSGCSKKNYATGETSTFECNLCVPSNRPRTKKRRFACALSAPGSGPAGGEAVLLLLAALALARRAGRSPLLRA
jgi:hypothetical protein